jgi:hypothetical protein
MTGCDYETVSKGRGSALMETSRALNLLFKENFSVLGSKVSKRISASGSSKSPEKRLDMKREKLIL